MKKYNSFLGAFFSGDNGDGGYNAAYKKSALAKLYSSQDPAEQQMASEGLARIDPEAAQKWQMDSEERVKKHAQLLASLGPQNPLAVQAWKTRIKPELVRMYGDQAAALPDIPDESIMQYAQQLAGSGVGQPKVHSQYMGDDGNIRVVLSDGTEKTLGKYSPKYTPHFGADGTVSGYNPRTNELSPTAAPMAGGMQQVPQGADPMVGGLERINENIRVLKANGVPAEQINAWSEAEFAKLQQSVQGGVIQQPQQARVAVKPDAPKVETWDAPTAVIQNGKPVMIQRSNQGRERVRTDLAPADSNKAPSVDASNAAGFYSRMAQSEQIIQTLEEQGYSPASNKGDYFTAGGTLTNWATSPKGRQYYNAATNWIRANLRKESGAAIGVDEAKQEYSTYFPIPGDDKATIDQKRLLRQQTAEAVKGAGLPAIKYQNVQKGGKSKDSNFDPLGILK